MATETNIKEKMDLPFVPALLIIDLQEDFLPPAGSLAVPDGRSVIPVINDLVKLPWQTIIASKDWHPKNHCSFAVNHVDGVEFQKISFTRPDGSGESKEEVVWPVHCVQNTPGSEFPESFTGRDRLDDIVLKGISADREYYSAFQDTWGMEQTELDSLLKARGVTDVFVVGLALDYCVYNTAVDSVKRGYTTRVILEGTKPVQANALEEVAVNSQKNALELIHLDHPILDKVRQYVSKK